MPQLYSCVAMTDAAPSDVESPSLTPLAPSRTALWLNWRIAKYGVTPEARDHGRAMLVWIFSYHPEEIVRQTAHGMIKVLQKGKQ